MAFLGVFIQAQVFFKMFLLMDFFTFKAGMYKIGIEITSA
jgi:hypothetical protein